MSTSEVLETAFGIVFGSAGVHSVSILVWFDIVFGDAFGVVIGVAGNKTDMPRALSFNLEECRAMCTEWDASLHFTSALTGEGVNDLFLTVAKRSASLVAAQQKKENPIQLVSEPNPKTQTCCA